MFGRKKPKKDSKKKEEVKDMAETTKESTKPADEAPIVASEEKMDDAANSEAAEEKQAAPARRQQTISLNDVNASVSYANFCRVSGTPEELVVDFGLNEDPTGNMSRAIKVNQKVILNYFTAKRLLAALNVSLQRHEATFGILETDVRKRFTPEMMQQIEKMRQEQAPASTSA